MKVPVTSGGSIYGKSILTHGSSIYRGTMVTLGGKKVGAYAAPQTDFQNGSDAYSLLVEK